MTRVLVLGAGYLAGAIGQALTARGDDVVLSSRRRPEGAQAWAEVDVTEPAAVRGAVEAADQVVAVHGPSDITWCESHPDEALAAHRGGAEHLAAALGGRRVLLVSTDNVFPGRADSCAESAPTEPANVYGRAKLAAEDTLLAAGNALVLRVSLVYGWDPDGLRPNFFTTCLRSLRNGQETKAPEDHWNTPVLVDDVAGWTAALLPTRHEGVVHLGGPDRLARTDWARRIARAAGADPGLVRPVDRRASAYACRPRNACLHSERAAGLPELAGLAPVGVDAALARLVEER